MDRCGFPLHPLVFSIGKPLVFTVDYAVCDTATPFNAICGCGFSVICINVEVVKRDFQRVLVMLALAARRSRSVAEFTKPQPLWQTLVVHADDMTSLAQLSFGK